MLKKSHITNIEIYSDAWHGFRRGKLTSSRMVSIVGEKSIPETGNNYIYQKVGEELTGVSNDKEISEFNEDMEWGNKYEPEAIKAFGKKMGVEFLVTQKLISAPGSRFSSTPDAIWVHGECLLDSDEYNVSTAEGKCPRTYHRFIQLYMCKTPMDVLKIDKTYFWQTIDQMQQCGAAVGYFFVYHPLFPAGSDLNIVTFKQMELWDYFKKLSDRKKEAIQKFEEVLLKLKHGNALAS